MKRNTFSACFVLGFMAVSTASSMASIIAKYDFDSIDSTGQIVTDLSGSNPNHNADYYQSTTLSGNVPIAAPDNQSITLTSGNDGYLKNYSDITFKNSGRNEITIEGWVYLTSNSTKTYLGKIAKDTNNFVDVMVDKYGMPTFRVYSGAAHYATSNTPLLLNTWYHLAGVYNCNNDGVVRLYVNGTQVATNNASVSLFDVPTSALVSVGVAGMIDDVLIANHAYTAGEIMYDVTHSFTVPEPATMVLMSAGCFLFRKQTYSRSWCC